jgi:hypothetical protein
VADQDTDPRALPERKLAQPAMSRECSVADDELEHLGEVVSTAPEREAEPPCNMRHRPALDDDREEHDHEDDPVDPLRVVHLPEHGERAEQDGHGALEAAPDDEQLLAAVHPDRRERGPTASGLATRARTRARARPCPQTAASSRPANPIDSPSAANAAISASAASEEWNVSISPLRGIATSPRRTPATNTARKPEPCATEAIP